MILGSAKKEQVLVGDNGKDTIIKIVGTGKHTRELAAKDIDVYLEEEKVVTDRHEPEPAVTVAEEQEPEPAWTWNGSRNDRLPIDLANGYILRQSRLLEPRRKPCYPAGALKYSSHCTFRNWKAEFTRICFTASTTFALVAMVYSTSSGSALLTITTSAWNRSWRL
mgnify:CR=1 FL=1